MNLDDSLLINTGPYFPVKRKRFCNNSKNSEEEEGDGSDCLDDSMSSNSSLSSLVSTHSGFVNIKRHGHKVLVTDEKVTDTVNDLNKLDIDLENNQPSPASSIDLEDEKVVFEISSNSSSDEENQEIEEDVGLVLSDALKSRIKELNSEEFIIAQIKSGRGVYEHLNELQVIPWKPVDVVTCVNQDYNVEEPSENLKNKSKISQINRVQIVEVDPSFNIYSCNLNHDYTTFPSVSNKFRNFYLVEHEEDLKKYDDNFLRKNGSNLSIKELDDDKTFTNVNYDDDEEEEMEF